MIKNSLSNRTENKLYLKADARTPYTNVMNVLRAVRAAGVQAPNVLSAQLDAAEPGPLTPPKGLAVLVRPASPPGSEATVVQLLNSGQRRPTLRINDQHIPWANLRKCIGARLTGPSRESSSSAGRGDTAFRRCGGCDRHLPFDGDGGRAARAGTVDCPKPLFKIARTAAICCIVSPLGAHPV
jgi:hypothetical protein